MRFILQNSIEEGWWVCTDTAFGIVVKWKEHDFNGTQKVTPLEDNATHSAIEYATSLREMSEWLYATHKHIVL